MSWTFAPPGNGSDMTQRINAQETHARETHAREINADFSRAVAIDTEALPWIASPQAGVERRMLDRIGGEVARATTIVRYAPDSRFPTHRHDGGEEFLVLEGIFSDEHGDYPAGTYVRNPPGSHHAPGSAPGCTIFVKLRQMLSEEQTRLVLRPGADWNGEALADGRTRRLLHACPFGLEVVALERVPPGYDGPMLPMPRGEELLVLEGCLVIEGREWPSGSWLRRPAGQRTRLQSSVGATYWVKRGHL